MNANKFTAILKEKKLLVSDGATGTNLIQRGLPQGTTAEEWVLDKPEKILRLHQDFIDAGSDLILTSTFGGSKIRLEQSGLADRFAEVNSKAVALAKEAAYKLQCIDRRVDRSARSYAETLGTARRKGRGNILSRPSENPGRIRSGYPGCRNAIRPG